MKRNNNYTYSNEGEGFGLKMFMIKILLNTIDKRVGCWKFVLWLANQ